MHDGVFFEDQGIPTATIVSAEFVKAARAQAEALGAREYKPVVVTHPIKPLLREEVQVLADKAWDEILARLTKN